MELKQRTKGGVWYAHFTGPTGERLRLSTGTADSSVAQLKALELMREHLVDKLPSEERHKLGRFETLGSLLREAWNEKWSEQNSAKATLRLINKLTRDIGHWSRDDVTKDRLKDYLNDLKVGKHAQVPVRPATKNRYVSAIHVALSVAADRPGSDYKVPKLPRWAEKNIKERYVSREEEAQILEWFRVHTAPVNSERMYLWDLVILLIDSGMRCGEALEQMTTSSVTMDITGILKVHLKHGETKSGHGRSVPLTKRAGAAATRMLASPHHGKWTASNAGRPFKRIVRGLGIYGVSLHTLRHTAASRLVQQGVDLYQVSIWLGHSSMEVTRRYAHLAPNTLNGALAALERANGVAAETTGENTHPVAEAHPQPLAQFERPKLKVIK